MRKGHPLKQLEHCLLLHFFVKFGSCLRILGMEMNTMYVHCRQRLAFVSPSKPYTNKFIYLHCNYSFDYPPPLPPDIKKKKIHFCFMDCYA